MKTLILNKNTPQIIVDDLKNEYNIVFTAPIDVIEGPLKYHTDIQIFKVDDDTFICEPSVYEYYVNALKGKKIICGSTFLKSNYPYDIAYNITRVGNRCLCYEKYADKQIIKNLNCKVINIKQGYSKCNICVVDDNSIITSDEGIYRVCIDNGIDALKITQGQIELNPFEYGFIGGASMKLSEKELLFFGNIKSHTDYEKIKEFCTLKKVKIKCYSNEKLTDLGGGFVCI